MRFACSMSRSIDPRRPYKPSAEDSSSINKLPRVCALQELVQKRKQARDLCSDKYKLAEGKYEQTLCEPQNKKQQQRRRLLQENVEQYQDKYDRADQKYKRALRELRNEKQRQRNRLVRENLV